MVTLKSELTIDASPHIHSSTNTNRIMLYVCLSLLPAMASSIYLYGHMASLHYIFCITACLLFESLFNLLVKKTNTINDYSAVLTGILLAMNLPAAAPYWIDIVGSFVAIIIAKMLFGGLGGNPFNPALVARVFLLISFPVQMTLWTNPKGVDSVSSATVLSSSKMYMQSGDGTLSGFTAVPLNWDLLLGTNTGSLGETCVIAILLGGLFLIMKRIITWHIPLSFIGTVFILVTLHNFFKPDTALPAITHILSGGLILGAFYMATDYVTAPLTNKSKLIFGIGCGILTVLIRMFANYPEGVAFAILIMNALTPIMDKYIKPRAYGSSR